MIPYLLAVAGGYLIGQSFKDDDKYASGGRIKSYEKVEGTDYELKIEVYYDKGGMNYFSGRPEERGYYASVSPVKIERRPNGITTEEYGAFSGIKTLVLRVARQSPKAEKEAEMLAQERIPELKNYVLGKMKDKGIIMAKGGAIGRMEDGGMSDGGLTNEILLKYHKTSGGAEYLLSNPVKTLKQKNLLSQSARFGDAKYIVRIDGAKKNGGELFISNNLFEQAMGRGKYSQEEVSDEADKKIVELGLQKEFEEYRENGKIIIKLFYRKTMGGAEYLTSNFVENDPYRTGSFDSKYIVRIDGAKNHGGELLIKDIKEEDTYAEGGDIEEFSLWVIGDEPQKIKTGTSRAIKSFYTKNQYTEQFNEWKKKGYGIQQWPADATKEEVVRYNKSNRGSATSQEYAQGGVLEHGLREDDRILVERGRFAGIKNDKTGEKFIVDIEEGSRTPSRL